MKETINKYHLLIKYAHVSIEDLHEMSECEITLLANEIINKIN